MFCRRRFAAGPAASHEGVGCGGGVMAPESASVEAPAATDPAAAEAAAPTVQPPDEAARLVEVLTAENAQLRSHLTAAADHLGTAPGRGHQWRERAGGRAALTKNLECVAASVERGGLSAEHTGWAGGPLGCQVPGATYSLA
jgi:hypothetical protein